MSDGLTLLCYLTLEQLRASVNLKQLSPLVSAGTPKLVANAHMPAIDPKLGILDGEQMVSQLMEGMDRSWHSETIWEPSGKAWLATAQANQDLIIVFAERDKSKYRLPVEWSTLQIIEKPVLVVNPGKKRRKRDKILAAIDVANKKQQDLNDHILGTAAQLANFYGAELHIITAVEVSQVAADLDLVDPIKQEVAFREKYLVDLERMAATFGVHTDHIHVTTGVPSEVIRKQAKKLDVIMTTVGTERRSGLTGLLFGNTVDAVLGQSPNNVLVVPRPS